MKTLKDKVKDKVGGGKLSRKISERLAKRSKNLAKRAAKSKAKSQELYEKSKTVASGKGAGVQNAKNFINEERAVKRGAYGNAQQKRSERAAKAAKFFAKRSELSAANKDQREVRKEYRKAKKAHRARKADIRAKYNDGGRLKSKKMAEKSPSRQSVAHAKMKQDAKSSQQSRTSSGSAIDRLRASKKKSR